MASVNTLLHVYIGYELVQQAVPAAGTSRVAGFEFNHLVILENCTGAKLSAAGVMNRTVGGPHEEHSGISSGLCCAGQIGRWKLWFFVVGL